MSKLLINPMLATSVTNQAEMVKRLAEDYGYEAELTNAVNVPELKEDNVLGGLFMALFSIRYCQRIYHKSILNDKPVISYVTIEGYPHKSTTNQPPLKKLEYIANSRFTKKCLEKRDFKVKDVVHHAIDIDECKGVREKENPVKKKWSEKFGDKTIFYYCGRDDPRKNLKGLSFAVDILNESRKEDFVVLLRTEGTASEKFNQDNVFKCGNFGDAPFERVLQEYDASNYLVFPSISEGFGLPVLEANAMGTPVVHNWMPPISEFSNDEFNFVFDYSNEELVQNGNIQYWIFHQYDPPVLADTMDFAINYHQEEPEEYKEFCKKAVEHARNWDYRNIYKDLLNHLGMTEERAEDVPTSDRQEGVEINLVSFSESS